MDRFLPEQPVIQTNHLSRVFQMGTKQECVALRDISISIPKQQLTILKGRSGSGKTTLLNLIGALDAPTKGTVFYHDYEKQENINLQRITEPERELLRRHSFGFVFQSVALFPVMSAYENIDFALRISGYQGNRKERILEVLELVGLKERANHLPGQLSGGEQQRVGIARAIAHRPKLLLADEPTGALDTASAVMVMEIFLELIQKEQVTVVMTTHDPHLMELGHEVIELANGGVLVDRVS